MPNLALHCIGPMLRPVSVAQALKRHGLGLREAHRVLNGLAEGKPVSVRLRGSADPTELRRELAELNVSIRPETAGETTG